MNDLLTILQVVCTFAALLVLAWVLLAKQRLSANRQPYQSPPTNVTNLTFAADSNNTEPVINNVELTQGEIWQGGDSQQMITPEDYKWWRVVVERAPHVLLVGDTDSGKTTTARALAKERSYTGKVLVIDPNATPDRWGIPAIGAGHRFDQINQVLKWLTAELTRRYQERAQGKTDQEDLTIIVDEMNLIVDECGDAAKVFLKRLARSGREARMKIVILGQSDRVRALNIEGEGDIREQFATVRLGYKAREKFPQQLAEVERPAALQYKSFNAPVNVFFMMLYEQMEFNQENILTLSDLVSENNASGQNRDEIMAQSVKKFVEMNVSEPKQISGVSSPEMAVETGGNVLVGFSRNDFLAAAKLIRAGVAGETKILETLFKVKPGGSAAYQEARQRLREAQEQLDREEGR